MSLRDGSWFVVFNVSALVIMSNYIQDLPFVVCTILFLASLVTVSLTFAPQYDSNGVVKPFRHPEWLRVLNEKASNADVVSVVFSDGSLSRVMFL